jgi:Xaa-Pro aminopeptidase
VNSPPPMFDVAAVKERRLRQFDELMARHDLAAIVISSAEFFQFYANFTISTFYWERPFALVVPRRGAAFAIVNAVAENGVRMQVEKGVSWVGDFSFYSEVPQLRAGAPLTAEFAKALAKALTGRGLDRGRIGYDARTGAIASLASALPAASLHDVAKDLKELRWVKHGSEIRIMQMAADLGSWAMQALRGELRPGRLLQELDQTVGARLMEEAARRVPGHNFLIAKIITLSGAASASTDGDGAPTGAVVQADVPTVSTIVTRLNGYSVEVHRTFWIGTPSPSQEGMLQAALRMNEAAIGQAFAGNRLSAIDEEAVKAARAAGVERYITHRAGHGIGTATHEYPEDLPVNRRTIERGEVFSLEPALYVAGLGGFRFGDAVVAEATPHVLTTVPKAMADMVVR